MRPDIEQFLNLLGVFKDIAEMMLAGIAPNPAMEDMAERLEDTIDSFEVVEAFIRMAESTISTPK